MPLWNLSALTQLAIHGVGEGVRLPVGVDGLVAIVAQIKELKQLELRGLAKLADPALCMLQLAPLPALESLTLQGGGSCTKALRDPALEPLAALTALKSLTLQGDSSCTRTLRNKVGAQ